MTDREIAQQLVRDGLLGPDQAKEAMARAESLGVRLDTAVAIAGRVGERDLLAALGRLHNSRTVSGVELATVPPSVLRKLPPRAACRYEIVPFRLDGNTLSIATLTPGDLLVEDEVGLLTSCKVASFVTLEARLHEALDRYYQQPRSDAMVEASRRLSGLPPPAARAAAARGRDGVWGRAIRSAKPAVDRSRPSTSRPSSPAQTARPGRRQVEDPELELTEEDLGQFPSLAQEVQVDPVEASPTPPTDAQIWPTPGQLEGPSLDWPGDLTPEERLAAAAAALELAEMRDDIADVLLAFCAPYFRRRMVLILRKDHIVGWRGEGENVDESAVRAIEIPTGEPSVFHGLLQGMSFWMGPMPPMARNLELALALGGAEPRECVVLPVTLRSKVVCLLYGDNGGGGIGGAPLAELRRLAAKAGLAFEVYILKSKIRRL
jgi:hypothetical protein